MREEQISNDSLISRRFIRNVTTRALPFEQIKYSIFKFRTVLVTRCVKKNIKGFFYLCFVVSLTIIPEPSIN
ncbi:unnamed protein product, partial [Brenthis ino]